MQQTARRGFIRRHISSSQQLSREHRPLIANALMHLVNDGCFVAIYPILPLIALEFDLNYAQVGLLKTALTASSTAFQIPMALMAERFGEIAMLALGMAWVGAGFMVLGLAVSFIQTLFLMVAAGTGGSVQHPVASSFISREYEGRRRGSALGVLNFAGDLGKFIIPLVFAVSLTAYGWRASLAGLGAVSFVFALLFWYFLRDKGRGLPRTVEQDQPAPSKGWGILQPKTFGAILSMGVLDSSVRSALLTFVPFLLIEKGLSATQAGLMLTVIFAGGAAGKLGCGILADKLGTTRMIVFTETMTGALILLLLPVGQWTMLPLLFCVGFFLNGTSSVLLDGVAELFDATK
ncbi:MAG: hypothetical protein ETSY2_24075, partial [Candidatus Entotheonella gemina]